jgi:hypothetical protein
MPSSLRLLRAVWLASLALTFAVAWTAWALPPPRHAFPQPRMIVTMAVLAPILLGLSFLVPKQSMRAAVQPWRRRLRDEALPEGAAVVYRSPPASRRVLRLRERDVIALVARSHGPWLFSLAMCEAVALLGLALDRIGAEEVVTTPFFFVSAAFLIWHRPSRRRLLEQVGRAFEATVVEPRDPASSAAK